MEKSKSCMLNSGQKVKKIHVFKNVYDEEETHDDTETDEEILKRTNDDVSYYYTEPYFVKWNPHKCRYEARIGQELQPLLTLKQLHYC